MTRISSRSDLLRAAGPFLRLALLVAGLEIVAAFVAGSVAAVDPALLAPAPPAHAGLRALALWAGAGLVLLLARVVAGALLAAAARVPLVTGRRAAETPPPRDDEPVWDVAWALLLAAALVYGVPRYALLFTREGLPFELPLLARGAFDLIPWLLGGCLAEALLASARRLRRRETAWWLARGVVGLFWVVLFLRALTGPNLLMGDPLEWAARLKSATLSQGWLVQAPLAAGAWWPIVRTGLSTALLATLLVTLGEFWQAWKSYRDGRSGPSGPAGATRPAGAGRGATPRP